MAKLANVAARVWKGEVRGIVYATVDVNRHVNPQFYLLSTAGCSFDMHMPVTMAQYLLHDILNHVQQVTPKKDNPE